MTWVMMGKVVSSLMDMVCNVDRGRILLGTRIRHRVMVARVAWMSPIGHPWQGDLEVGIGRPTYLELDWEGGASP